jgi:phosphoglycolate phosphatase
MIAAGIRAAVFDLDGTLVDSYGPITASLNHARANWGLAPLPEEVVRTRVGHGLEALVAQEVGADRVAEGVRLFREKYAEIFAEQTRALPDALDTLRDLSDKGYSLSVASNKPARFSRVILDRLGMLRFLAHVAGPDTAGSTKPDPPMIRSCLEAMQSTASETLYVGDMVLDVESGRRAGLPVVLVAGGSASLDELRGTGCPVVETLRGLSDRLPRLEADSA